MVLINNKTGEIKVGKQGEAVYQRRYGRQIRRVRSKKRGERTKRQKDRMTLFSQTLAWRAGLNRHDRLVLEQYGYYAHLTDAEGITLTWDKVALKIALEIPTVTILK